MLAPSARTVLLVKLSTSLVPVGVITVLPVPPQMETVAIQENSAHSVPKGTTVATLVAPNAPSVTPPSTPLGSEPENHILALDGRLF